MSTSESVSWSDCVSPIITGWLWRSTTSSFRILTGETFGMLLQLPENWEKKKTQKPVKYWSNQSIDKSANQIIQNQLPVELASEIVGNVFQSNGITVNFKKRRFVWRNRDFRISTCKTFDILLQLLVIWGKNTVKLSQKVIWSNLEQSIHSKRGVFEEEIMIFIILTGKTFDM